MYISVKVYTYWHEYELEAYLKQRYDHEEGDPVLRLPGVEVHQRHVAALDTQALSHHTHCHQNTRKI